jgi:hypothetical protein
MLTQSRILLSCFLSRLHGLGVKEMSATCDDDDRTAEIRLNSGTSLIFRNTAFDPIGVILEGLPCAISLKLDGIDMYHFNKNDSEISLGFSIREKFGGGMHIRMMKRTCYPCKFSKCQYFTGCAKRSENDVQTVWCGHDDMKYPREVPTQHCQKFNEV